MMGLADPLVGAEDASGAHHGDLGRVHMSVNSSLVFRTQSYNLESPEAVTLQDMRPAQCCGEVVVRVVSDFAKALNLMTVFLHMKHSSEACGQLCHWQAMTKPRNICSAGPCNLRVQIFAS